MIAETCSCGARFKTDEAEAVKLAREWRRTHKHTDNTDNTDITDTPTSGLADTQIAMGFQPGEMPAKEYDPWDD